jgi:hypothetical protein
VLLDTGPHLLLVGPVPYRTSLVEVPAVHQLLHVLHDWVPGVLANTGVVRAAVALVNGQRGEQVRRSW